MLDTSQICERLFLVSAMRVDELNANRTSLAEHLVHCDEDLRSMNVFHSRYGLKVGLGARCHRYMCPRDDGDKPYHT